MSSCCQLLSKSRDMKTITLLVFCDWTFQSSCEENSSLTNFLKEDTVLDKLYRFFIPHWSVGQTPHPKGLVEDDFVTNHVTRYSMNIRYLIGDEVFLHESILYAFIKRKDFTQDKIQKRVKSFIESGQR